MAVILHPLGQSIADDDDPIALLELQARRIGRGRRGGPEDQERGGRRQPGPEPPSRSIHHRCSFLWNGGSPSGGRRSHAGRCELEATPRPGSPSMTGHVGQAGCERAGLGRGDHATALYVSGVPQPWHAVKGGADRQRTVGSDGVTHDGDRRQGGRTDNSSPCPGLLGRERRGRGPTCSREMCRIRWMSTDKPMASNKGPHTIRVMKINAVKTASAFWAADQHLHASEEDEEGNPSRQVDLEPLPPALTLPPRCIEDVQGHE